MKTVGIIGGIGPESTIEYYRLLIESYRAKQTDGSYPSIIINSINLSKVVELVTANRLAEVTKYLAAEVDRLARAGADFGALSANTPHIVFDDLSRQSPIPLISIVQAACDAANAQGLKRLALFGTRFTMQGRFYKDVFDHAGITLLTPNAAEQDYIHGKYMNELLNGIFLDETRDGLLAIVKRMSEEEGVGAVILGGTELPLILRAETYGEVVFLDTTRIHVEQIVAQLI